MLFKYLNSILFYTFLLLLFVVSKTSASVSINGKIIDTSQPLVIHKNSLSFFRTDLLGVRVEKFKNRSSRLLKLKHFKR